MKISRILSLLLAAAVMTAAVSCGSGETAETTAGILSDGPSAAAETLDSLPAGLDFGGADFTIHYYESNAMEWLADEENGELVNDAIYRRNLAVSERLNVRLNYYYSGTAADYQSGQTGDSLRAGVMAGDGAFDLIAGYSAYINRGGLEEIMLNLNDVKYLDFDQPWWFSDMVKELNINGVMYYMAGDIGLSALKNYDVLFFNAAMADSYGFSDLFDLALDGKWTLDEMRKCIKAVTADLNSDGKIDDENDRTGLLLFDKYSGLDAFLSSFRQPLTESGADGLPKLCMNNDRMVTIVEKLNAMFNEEPGCPFTTLYHPESETHALKRLAAGDTLFFLGRLLCAEDTIIREMTDEWGVLPTPKLDEKQENYGVHLCNAYSLFCLPLDVKNPDMSGAVCEALASESYRSLTGAYYDTAIKTKYSRSEETIRVLDMLHQNVFTNFGILYPIGAYTVIRQTVLAKNPYFASWYASNEAAIQTTLDSVLEYYK